MLPVVRRLSSLVGQPAGEAVGDSRSSPANPISLLGMGLLGLQHLHRLAVGFALSCQWRYPAAAALAAVQHEAAAVCGPRHVQGRSHGPTPMDNGRWKRRNTGSPFRKLVVPSRGSRTTECRRRFLGLLFLLGGLLSRDAVVGKIGGWISCGQVRLCLTCRRQ